MVIVILNPTYKQEYSNSQCWDQAFLNIEKKKNTVPNN